MIPRILITPGEPAGIGPDITLKVIQQAWPAELVAVCDPELLHARARQLHLSLNVIPFDEKNITAHQAGTLKVIPVSLLQPAVPGKLARENATYVIRCLEIATDYCLQKKAHALVTGPVHKG